MAGGGARLASLERFVRELAMDHVLLPLACVCLVAIVAAATIRLPHTGVRLSLRAREVGMRIASEYRPDPMALGAGASVIGEGFDRIGTPGGGCVASRQISLKGELSLAAMKFDEGATLTAGVAGDRDLDLGIVGPASIQVAGSESVEQNGRRCAEPGATVDLFVRAGDRAKLLLEAATAKAGAAPRAEKAAAIADFQLRAIRVSSLRFFYGAGWNAYAQPSESSVRSGELVVEDTGDAEKLTEGEEVSLDVVAGTVERLAFDKGDLSLEFRGRVNGATVGPSTDRRDLRPTILDWLGRLDFATKSFAFLGAILVFLWRYREWARNPPVVP